MTALRRLCSSAAGLFGLIVVVLILVTALVSLFWTPFDPRATDVTSRWLPPGWPHLLGTDLTGRDILSLLMAGARTTVLVSAGAGLVATLIGIALGALGALTARWVRETIAVFVDILIAFPVLIIAMLISTVQGGSLWVVVWAVGIGFGVNVARVTRPELRRVQHSDFVVAGRADAKGPAALAQHDQRTGRIEADALDALRGHTGKLHRLANGATDGAPDIVARLLDDVAGLVEDRDVAPGRSEHRARLVEDPGPGAAGADVYPQEMIRHACPSPRC